MNVTSFVSGNGVYRRVNRESVSNVFINMDKHI